MRLFQLQHKELQFQTVLPVQQRYDDIYLLQHSEEFEVFDSVSREEIKHYESRRKQSALLEKPVYIDLIRGADMGSNFSTGTVIFFLGGTSTF